MQDDEDLLNENEEEPEIFGLGGTLVEEYQQKLQELKNKWMRKSFFQLSCKMTPMAYSDRVIQIKKCQRNKRKRLRNSKETQPNSKKEI